MEQKSPEEAAFKGQMVRLRPWEFREEKSVWGSAVREGSLHPNRTPRTEVQRWEGVETAGRSPAGLALGSGSRREGQRVETQNNRGAGQARGGVALPGRPEPDQDALLGLSPDGFRPGPQHLQGCAGSYIPVCKGTGELRNWRSACS